MVTLVIGGFFHFLVIESGVVSTKQMLKYALQKVSGYSMERG